MTLFTTLYFLPIVSLAQALPIGEGTDNYFLGPLADLSFLQDFSWDNSPSILDDEKIIDADYDNGADYTGSRPWRRPNFLRHGDFTIPTSVRPLVNFWIDIYSKYSNDEGVLHDLEFPDLVYEILDFRDIENDSRQGPVRKELNRIQRIKLRKQAVLKSLNKLSRKKIDIVKLTENEKRIYDYFAERNLTKELRRINSSSRIRFQLGQKDRMQTAIYYSGRYLEDIETIFKEEEVPLELSRLPFVESSFNIFAYSKVGASGIWQVMPSSSPQPVRTRNYFDLRNYPLEATRMATRILKQGYKLTGNWALAAIGYNHGPSGVRRKVDKYHTSDIGILIGEKRAAFGFASRNFLPCLFAVLEVEGHAKKYFNKIRWSDRLNSISFKIPVNTRYKDVLSWYDGDKRKLQVHNPHLTPMALRNNSIIPANTPLELPSILANDIKSEFEIRTKLPLAKNHRNRLVMGQTRQRK